MKIMTNSSSNNNNDEIKTLLEKIIADVENFKQEFRQETQRLTQETQHLTQETQHLTQKTQHLTQETEEIKKEVQQNNTRIDAYQRASNQVVNLAFSLIASATITLILTSVFKR